MGSDTVIVPIHLPNGKIAYIEATKLQPPAAAEVGDQDYSDADIPILGRFLERKGKGAKDEPTSAASGPLRFEEALAQIEGISQLVHNKLVATSPTKAVLEFGLEAGVESGQLVGLIVQGSAKANLKITLEWNNPTTAKASG